MINNLNDRVNDTKPIWIVSLLAFALWLPTIRFGFVWDDFPTIVTNPSLLHWDTIGRAFLHDFWQLHDIPKLSGYWRPLPTIVYLFIQKIFGLHAIAFHLFNVLVHTLNCIWVFFILGELQWKKRTALFATLLFALHPLHAETISFVSALPDLLAASFGLASCAMLLRKKNMGGCLLLVAALLSKESAVVFILLAGWIVWPARKILLALLVLSLSYFALHAFVTGGLGARPIWGESLDQHLGTVAKLFPFSFFLTIFPIGSSPAREFQLSNGVTDPFAWGGAFALIATLVLVFHFRKSRPALSFSLLLFILFWLPISNLIPAEGLIADRYLYLPSIGTVLFLGNVLEPWLIQKQTRIFWGIWLVVWMVWSFRNTLPWESEEKLWGHAIQTSPNVGLAWDEWGVVQLEKQNLSEAESAFRKALALAPTHREASLNLALVLYYEGKGEAADQMERHLQQFPSDAGAWDLKATLLMQSKDVDGALRASSEAVKLEEKNWKYRFNYGTTLLHSGKCGDAVKELKHSSDLTLPHPRIQMNLAAGYFCLEDWGRAKETYENVLRQWPEVEEARNNLAIVERRKSLGTR